MWVKVIRMRESGVAIAKHMLNDRYTVKKWGELTILDVTDQGLRRQIKVARLVQRDAGASLMELVDPHVLWMSGDRFVLSGFERCVNATGQPVDYAQSWLCAAEQAHAEDALSHRDVTTVRRAKR